MCLRLNSGVRPRKLPNPIMSEPFRVQFLRSDRDLLLVWNDRWPRGVTETGGIRRRHAEITHYWLSEFDWSAHEHEMNRVPHFRAVRVCVFTTFTPKRRDRDAIPPAPPRMAGSFVECRARAPVGRVVRSSSIAAGSVSQTQRVGGMSKSASPRAAPSDDYPRLERFAGMRRWGRRGRDVARSAFLRGCGHSPELIPALTHHSLEDDVDEEPLPEAPEWRRKTVPMATCSAPVR